MLKIDRCLIKIYLLIITNAVYFVLRKSITKTYINYLYVIGKHLTFAESNMMYMRIYHVLCIRHFEPNPILWNTFTFSQVYFAC